ncbi:hypothetical protein [Pseudoxanthomonas suwonensis]|uniref:Uncharacterized protein n=1 Tax=Pseudoxanthomonas suwonensis TaxID=314722 RepID=A0A0E3Z2D9_9GAMM|nr:hypothetical protein [Pseudoxanthomonas suwonensis]AKC87714.1 hypothetical protein WQ53_14080 [Pseudoxanthomonas suwonensis]
MLRLLKWLALALLAVVLFVVAVWLVSRAMGPSAAEREALALIDAPPENEGRDGFAALYTVARQVPEAEQAGVLAEDVRRFAATPPAPDGSPPPWRSALEDWPDLVATREDDPAWCTLREPGCLERVRAAPQAYAALLERNATLLDRAVALAAWGHFRNPFAVRFDTPLPAYQPMTRLATRDAWRFAAGDVDAALAGVCSGVLQGRRMVEAGDSLIGSMIGATLVQGNATLLAEMLAELPRGHALPARCDAAFALPLALEDGVCRTMLAEGRFATGGLRSHVTTAVAAEVADRDWPKWGARLLFDPERTVARGAPKFAWYCGAQARELIARDRPLRDPTPPPSRWSLACASNAAGCILADIAAPAYADYGLRLQDADARLRTMAALLWLRGRDGEIDEAALAQLPAPMRSPARPLRLDAVAGTLVTALHERPREGPGGHAGNWSVPLPASRLQAAGAPP